MIIFIDSIKHRILQGGFINNVLLLVGGTAFSQFLLLVTAPLITRLYSPEDFGIWSIIRSLGLIFATIASFRYELSIVIPEEDREAANLFLGCILITLFMTGVSTLVTTLWGSQLAIWMSAETLIPWLWVLPVTLLMTGLYQIGNYWSTRSDQFIHLASSRIAQSVVMVAIQIVFAMLLGGSASGLIWGAVIGQAVAVVILLSVICFKDGEKIAQAFSLPIIKQGLSKHRNFPLYVAPYGVAGMLQQQVQTILLAKYASTQIVGLYSLANSIVRLPVSLIASALNQAFFPKAAQGLRDGNLADFVNQILKFLVFFTTPLFALFIFHAEEIFIIIFGQKWGRASSFGILLSIPAFMLIYTSWIDRIYDVLGKQRLALTLEVTYDVVSVATFGVTMVVFQDSLLAVGVSSVICLLYNFIWLMVTFKVAHLPFNGIWHAIKVFTCIFVSAFTLHLLSSNYLSIVLTLVVEVSLVTVYYVWLGLNFRKLIY